MALLNYGNFLPDSEIEKARYSESKPVISFALVLIIIFLVVGCFVNLVVVAYTAAFYRPVNIDNAKFESAKKLHSELQVTVKNIKDTGLKHGSAAKITSLIASTKPGSISLNSISITDKKLSVSGSAPSVEDVHVYLNSLTVDGKRFILESVNGQKNLALSNQSQMVVSGKSAVPTTGPVDFILSYIDEVQPAEPTQGGTK